MSLQAYPTRYHGQGIDQLIYHLSALRVAKGGAALAAPLPPGPSVRAGQGVTISPFIVKRNKRSLITWGAVDASRFRFAVPPQPGRASGSSPLTRRRDSVIVSATGR